MNIEYQNKPIDWDNAGVTPPQDLIEKGFQPGYKPPAEYFNAILHNTSEAIKEIQEKTVELADSAGGVGSAIIDVACTYADGEYTITTDVDLQSEAFFCLRFVAPNDYVKDTVFTIGSESYTAVNAGFKANDLVILNFDVSQQKCFFVSGGGAGDSDTITAKIICVGNGEEHKGGIYIGDTPIPYGEADDKLNDSIILGALTNTAGQYSIVSGYKNTCSAVQCLVLGFSNDVQGMRSIVAGSYNISKKYFTLIVGENNTLGTGHSAVIGCNNNIGTSTTEDAILVVGRDNTSGIPTSSSSKDQGSSYTIICGQENDVTYSLSTGVFGAANDIRDSSYSGIFGNSNSANNAYGVGMFGFGNVAKNINFVCGKFNKTPSSADKGTNQGDLFIIGNGSGTFSSGLGVTATTRSNAFRVTAAGAVMGTQNYTASGADYAEMFEWADGNPDNEDRRGLFVTLDGEKIRPASADDDYILGVVSATPSVVADAQTDDWGKKWKTDIFGERLLDENGAWILNENFREEDNESYVSRLDRKEWAAVGLVGKLIIVDDGTCEVNGYCKPTKVGTATKSETGYRVLSRIDENHIKVLIK